MGEMKPAIAREERRKKFNATWARRKQQSKRGLRTRPLCFLVVGYATAVVGVRTSSVVA